MSSSSSRLHASELLVDLDNITVRYGEVTVIDDVSFCVHSGDFVALIGPNGAGKSTLLRVLLGLLKPERGKVRVATQRLGYVPQQSDLRQSHQVPLSVLEVVRLSGAPRPMALEKLKEVNMERSAKRLFSELSGGQQQRVLIARALAAEPELLILDEPTTGIDEQSQHQFYELLTGLRRKGIAIIMVSHDIDTVLNVVDRVICLSRKIVYDGSAAHFEMDKYIPRAYGEEHKILHHHHKGAVHV